MKTELTQEKLKELLTYDPETGWFTRNTAVGGQEIGAVAGTVHPNGNVYIRITGEEKYLASRLAWLYMKGYFPDIDIDHEDTNRTNNIWTNLREATRSQNKANHLHEAGISGTRGVWPHGKKFRAAIKINQKRRHLGMFNTREEAEEAYLQARMEAFGEYNPKSMQVEPIKPIEVEF